MRRAALSLVAIGLAAVGTAPASADLFLPGPWVVYFAPSSARPVEASDRYLAEGLDRVVRTLGDGAPDYAACHVASPEPVGVRRQLEQRRLKLVQRIVAQHTGAKLVVEQSLCAAEPERPLPGILVMPRARAS